MHSQTPSAELRFDLKKELVYYRKTMIVLAIDRQVTWKNHGTRNHVSLLQIEGVAQQHGDKLGQEGFRHFMWEMT